MIDVQNSSKLIRLELPATYKYLNVLGACFTEILARENDVRDPEITTYNIQLSVHELCTNIIQHAYVQNTGDERISITIEGHAFPRRLVVQIFDTGEPFDQSQVKEPDLDHGQEHGYGLFLIRSLMNEVTYTRLPEGNCWRLVKILEGA